MKLLPIGAWITVQMPNDDPLTDWASITKAPLSRQFDWMAVVIMTASKDEFLCWGVVQAAPFVLIAPEGPHAPQLTIERLDRSQCSRLPPPPASTPVDYDSHPAVLPTRLFSLDELDGLLKARLQQYKKPTDACLVTTPEQRAVDRLSFSMACASIARYRDLHRGADERISSLEHWLRGEQRIALHRFRVAHLPHALRGWEVFSSSELETYSGFGGLPFSDAPPEFMILGREPDAGILAHGHLFLAPSYALAWVGTVMRQVDQGLRALAMHGEFPSFRDHVHLMRMLDAFHAEMASWNAPPVVPKKSAQRRGVVIDSTLASATLAELKTVMPGCMKPLADRAFLRGPAPHLKYEERCILYGFILANGIPAVVLEKELLDRLQAIPNYDTRQIITQVKETDKYVRTPKFGTGWGCRRLQDSARCPWFHQPSTSSSHAVPDVAAVEAARSQARVSCHQHQLNLANLHTDPNPKWSIFSPIVFAQDLKRLLLSQASSSGTKRKL